MGLRIGFSLGTKKRTVWDEMLKRYLDVRELRWKRAGENYMSFIP